MKSPGAANSPVRKLAVTTPRRGHGGLVVALALLVLAGCAPAKTNLVLIVVDTLRWDHVGSYGDARPITPALDALAAEGVRFEHAYSTSSWTQPAVASMLTGRYPSGHGVNGVDQVLAPEAESLVEVLRDAGYATAAVVSHHLLSSKYGFSQGFETYRESEARGARYVSTPGVTRQAIALLGELSAGEAPFVLLVHYFDPHYHYVRHPEIGFAADAVGQLDGTEGIRKLRRMGSTLTPEEIGFLRDLYAEEVRFTDDGIGALVAELARLGHTADTVVAVTADHGEEFFERGWLGHTHTLYEELVRVPFIVRAPGGARGEVVAAPVSVVDLAPTLLELLGFDVAERDFQGRSLAAAVRGAGSVAPQPVYAEVDYRPQFYDWPAKLTSKQAIVVDGRKLIVDRLEQRTELYDLAEDPHELHDLAAQRPEQVRELLAVLHEMARTAGAGAIAAPRRTPTSDEKELLRELGYLE